MAIFLPEYDRSDGVALFLDGKQTAAFCHFLMGADTYDDDRSAFFVAYQYEFGLGIPQNFAKAYEYYISCADADEGEAAYNLAILHHYGLGTTRNLRRFLEWMEKSAEAGCIEAQLYMAGTYLGGYLNPPSVFAVTLLPFHRAVYETPMPLLGGNVSDFDDAERASLVMASESDAVRMLTLAASHDEDYAGRFLGDAKFILAQTCFEGFAREIHAEGGSEIDRSAGEKLLYEAAVLHGSPDANRYIAAHSGEFLLPKLRRFLSLNPPPMPPKD